MAHLGKLGRRNAGEPAPGCTILEHGRMIDAAHHLRTRAIVFGDAQCMPRPVRIELQCPCADGSGGKGIPCPRRVIVGHAGMQGKAGPGGNLVTDDQPGHELPAGNGCLAVRKCKQRRDDNDAHMALGALLPVMGVK